MRRFSGPPTMTCFSDFMFLYVGNNEELSIPRFESIPDSLTYIKGIQEFNLNLIKNRFNFLMYNSHVYKNLIFNYNIRPKIFQNAMIVLKYIENLLQNQSENYQDIMINPYLVNENYLDGIYLIFFNFKTLKYMKMNLKKFYKKCLIKVF